MVFVYACNKTDNFTSPSATSSQNLSSAKKGGVPAETIASYLTVISKGVIDLADNQEFCDLVTEEVKKQEVDGDFRVTFDELNTTLGGQGFNLENAMVQSLLNNGGNFQEAQTLKAVFTSFNVAGREFKPQLHIPFFDEEMEIFDKDRIVNNRPEHIAVGQLSDFDQIPAWVLDNTPAQEITLDERTAALTFNWFVIAGHGETPGGVIINGGENPGLAIFLKRCHCHKFDKEGCKCIENPDKGGKPSGSVGCGRKIFGNCTHANKCPFNCGNHPVQ